MKTPATVLIADRNPHVRGFLKRELSAAGFTVLTADSGKELLHWVYGSASIDLLVVDPDLPDMESACLLKKLTGRIPPCPLIIHALSAVEAQTPNPNPPVAYVEKDGRSVERLKEVIASLLAKPIMST